MFPPLQTIFIVKPVRVLKIRNIACYFLAVFFLSVLWPVNRLLSAEERGARENASRSKPSADWKRERGCRAIVLFPSIAPLAPFVDFSCILFLVWELVLVL